MGLGHRSARQHETVGFQKNALDSSVLWEFKPKQQVMTVDGVPGVVTAVLDGPYPGTEEYEVTLNDGLGGGSYTASQLSPLAGTTASHDHEATGLHLASDDYEELRDILHDRPPIERMTFSAARGDTPFDFQHEEVDTGGTKFPRRVDMTAHHPETGEEAGRARYYPPKRKGGPISIDEVKGHVPGAASALLNEIEERHPGSSTKFLWEVKRNNNNPDVTGHAHEHAGQPTDWDTHYPNVASTIHRGLALKVPSHSARVVNSSGNTKDEHLAEIHSAMPEGPNIGTHWTEDEHAAKLFAHNAVSDYRTTIPVVLHAEKPARKDLETRQLHLYRGGVFPYGDPHSSENEIPVRRGRDVKVTGISWRPDAPHPDADESGWLHHTYDEPKHHTAAMEDVEDEGTQEAEPEIPPCAYCGSDQMQIAGDTGRAQQAKCQVCGGMMSAPYGLQFKPELIGDPSNHPKDDPDPASGGVPGAANMRVPVKRMNDSDYTASLHTAKTLSWDEVGQHYPHIYGDPEVHGEDAEGADGEGIGWAANHLAHSRPDDPEGDEHSVDDLEFHPERVDPRHIDYARHGGPHGDQRVGNAYKGYKSNPDSVPPLVLVHRHGVYQVADGHHRAEAAAAAGVKVRAFVAHSPYPDEPSGDGGKAPYHGAEPLPREVQDENDLHAHMRSEHGYAEDQLSGKSDKDIARYHDQKHFDCPAEFRAKMGSLRVQSEEDTSYRMQHQAPDADYGAPLHDVSNMMPGFYEHPEWYNHGQEHLHESTSVIHGARGNPEKKVKIYRALPAEHAGKGFNTGDWVSTSKSYARDHAMSHKGPKHDWPVISTTVPAKHLHTEGDVHEWAYNGPGSPATGVAFKGGYHQEVRQRPDGSISPVQRKANPFKERAESLQEKGYSFSHYRPGNGDPNHTVVAYDPQDNWAGMVKAHENGDVHHAEIEPEHAHEPLEAHMRDMIAREIKKTGSLHEAGERDWCTFRHNARCFYPGPLNAEGIRLSTPQDRGPCAWDYWQQQVCPISEPGPMALMQAKGSKIAELQDPDFKFHFTASWSDVRAKARRIRSEGQVNITVATNEGVGGEVKGDHYVYETVLTYVPGTYKVGAWECGCKWAAFAWGRSPAYRRFEGRMCSHALAMQFEAQAKGMFGRTVEPNTERPKWLRHHTPVVTQFERDSGENLTRRAVPPGNMRRTYESALDVEGIYSDDHGLDLVHPPVYAYVAAELQDPVDAMKFMAALGMSHSAARAVMKDVSAERATGELHFEASLRLLAEEGGHEESEKKRCPDCGSMISANDEKCPHCHHVFMKHERHHGAKGMTRPCPTCHGSGMNAMDPYEDDEGNVIQDEPTECDDCQGKGTVEGFTPDEEHQEEQRYRQIKRDRVAQHMQAWHANGEGVGPACSPSCPLIQERRRTAANEPPSVAGVALKAADTGRVLMLQRGLHDEDDPAAGKWEYPGGHEEKGDRTSLDTAIREWEEETGHPFPEGGVVHHTWTSPNGIYQGHVVVIPEESAVQLGNGRSMVNPDNPDGDQHEQAAWWDPDDARKNPALREELKTGTPWKEIKAAGNPKTAATADPLYGLEEASPMSPPQHSRSQNPASTGWATAQDPHSWDDPEENSTNFGALPGDGFLGNLHDRPEPALPSTDGAESELDDERQNAGVGQYDENDAELTPNTTLASAGSAQDIVARFQATAAAQALGGGEGGHHAAQQASNKEIAHAAKEFLSKQALKDFNYAEQQELINEGARNKTMARNSDVLNIQDTHYAALEAALAAEDALEDSAELFA